MSPSASNRLRAALLGGLCISFIDACEVEPKAPELRSIAPKQIAGNTVVDITALGLYFDDESKILLDKQTLQPTSFKHDTLGLKTPPLARGDYEIRIQNHVGRSAALTLKVGNSLPVISPPGLQLIEAGQALVLSIEATDFDQDPLTLELTQTPSTAVWEADRKIFTWATELEDGGSNKRVFVSASDGFDTVSAVFEIRVLDTIPKQQVNAISPKSHQGDQSFELRVSGEHFTMGDQVYLDETALISVVKNAQQITAQVPPQPRGSYDITVRRNRETDIISELIKLEILNSVPRIELESPVRIPENQDYAQTIHASDFDSDAIRVYALNLPPGARFDGASRSLHFRPDFIQGNQTHAIIIAATDGEATQTATLTLTVEDTIHPPWPTITSTEVYSNHLRLRLSQSTDDYLESPSEAGRNYVARVVIPDAATPWNKLPVRVFLHGFGGAPYTGGAGDQFRIYPADPDNTYWWGHQNENTTPNYTQRRVLHLVEWLLRHYPSADPDRVYVTGPSMGGAGSAELGLLHARHFSHIDSSIGQMIARNHRPARVRQLSTLWGSPEDNFDSDGIGVWDRQDLTRALRDEFDAQNQFIYTKHGKDDPTIHFGAVSHESPQTMYSFYDALQAYRIGHFVVWDEGGHGSADPFLGNRWWDNWNRATDEITFLRRKLAFPAFSNSSADDDPGDGGPNGRQTWDDARGYAGRVSTPGDTGFNGQLAGARNRYLRWDSRAIVDQWDRFEIPLRAQVESIQTAPPAGYPPHHSEYFGPLPIRTDVTLRRVQVFHCQPQEAFAWRFGPESGIVRVGDDRIITVAQLEFTAEFQTLTLTRIQD